MIEENDSEEIEDKPFPSDLDPKGFGACTINDCKCKQFTWVNGSSKCGTSGCNHFYQKHTS